MGQYKALHVKVVYNDFYGSVNIIRVALIANGHTAVVPAKAIPNEFLVMVKHMVNASYEHNNYQAYVDLI